MSTNVQSYPQGLSRRPVGSVFETGSVIAARRYMSDVFRSHDLSIAPGETGVRMRHEAIRPGRVSLHWLRYGAPVTMTAPEMGGFYLFQFQLGGACEIRHRGRAETVAGGHGYAVDPSDPLSKTWDRECEQLIVRVDRKWFEAFAAREMGVDVDGRLDFGFDILPLASGPRCVVELADAVRDDAAQARNGFTHPRVTEHLDVTLMSLLLASFPHRFREEYDRAVDACAPYYVRRAEDYIRAHWREPIAIGDLAQAADVSVRSLFSGFRRFRGLTPMAYVKTLRLDLARDELLRADRAERSVTQIALSCGFTHMSRFARDFSARFGERPSAALGKERASRR
ncbi:MAG: AraC family transcriptional regulator [Pseudorhodoplanes sp.]